MLAIASNIDNSKEPEILPNRTKFIEFLLISGSETFQSNQNLQRTASLVEPSYLVADYPLSPLVKRSLSTSLVIAKSWPCPTLWTHAAGLWTQLQCGLSFSLHKNSPTYTTLGPWSRSVGRRVLHVSQCIQHSLLLRYPIRLPCGQIMGAVCICTWLEFGGESCP